MRLASRAGLATCLLFPLALLAAEPAATVTLLDGGATVIRGTARYALAEGVRIAAGDIVETGDEGIAIIEFPDGVELGLGPRTQLLAVALPRARGGAEVHVVSGTLKHVHPAKAAEPYRYATTLAVLTPAAGAMVAAITPAQVEAFVESGEAQASSDAGGAARRLKSGDFLTQRAGQKPAVTGRPTQPFIAALPRLFLDPLPSRMALYKDRDVAPKRLDDVTYAEVEPTGSRRAPDLRKPFLARFRGRAQDPAFRAALIETLELIRSGIPSCSPKSTKPKPDASGAPAARRSDGAARRQEGDRHEADRQVQPGVPRSCSSSASVVAAYVSRDLLQQNARDEVAAARPHLMESALATRAYTSKQVRAAARDADEVPVPAAIGSGLRGHRAVQRPAQEIPRLRLQGSDAQSDQSRATAPPTGKPTSSTSSADAADRAEIIGERDTPTGRSLYIARPIQIKHASPASYCHSTVDAAPKTHGREVRPGQRLRLEAERGDRRADRVGADDVPIARAEAAFKTFMVSLTGGVRVHLHRAQPDAVRSS